MSDYIVVSSVSYAPISGDDEKVMAQTHKDLKDLVGQVARATTPDLIVLPETICRTCDEQVPEGPTTQLLAGLAREYNCYITVPVHQKETKSEAVFNVLGLLDRRGELAGIYRKYIPVYPEFDHGTRPGPGATLIRTEFGPVGGVICFDLNFGELRDQYKKLKPKLLLFSSMYHGGLVQNFWALDVQAYFVGSVYRGTPCTIIDPQGTTLDTSNNYRSWASARINLDFEVVHLDKNRARFDDIHRKYGEAVRIVITGEVGTSVIYSESEERTAADIVDEFELVRLYDYFEWSRELRTEHLG